MSLEKRVFLKIDGSYFFHQSYEDFQCIKLQADLVENDRLVFPSRLARLYCLLYEIEYQILTSLSDSKTVFFWQITRALIKSLVKFVYFLEYGQVVTHYNFLCNMRIW